MKVLVTGHKGFIGTILTPMLLERGYEVVGLDSDLYRNCTYGEPPVEVKELIKDVRDAEESDVKGCDAIIHLAALSNDLLGNINPELTMEINYRASVRLAKLAKAAGVPRFLFSSSCSMYGAGGDDFLDESARFNPVTPYAESKVLSERDIAKLADENFSPVFLRNATAYGVSPRMRFDLVLNNLAAWAYTTGNILMKSDGTPWRPIVHIEDISRAFIAMLQAPRHLIHNQAFNIGLNAENYRIRELADFVKETIPGCEIGYAEGAGPDKRCYRVDFSKYAQAFPESPLQWSARRGAQQIYASYKKYGLGKDEYEGVKYKRILHIMHLLENKLIDNSLRWINGKN
ncbi:SDR family oxidoreductase [candidate division KSB1 bacterium]|nr:SDR family oxidoreductase [candidate division KSB1 bacterium]RQW09430.1 MAG: SDR family oxidoreductase [candidate division KSB1 bacterium]